MEHVRWLAEPTLQRPTIIAAFTGWNDAGDAASASVRALVERWGATAVAEIDPEPFTDFATIRPHVRIHDGKRSIVWPTVGVWSASVPGGDVLLVLGPDVIFGFTAAMLLGIVIGTFSSVYVSAAILLWLNLKPDSFVQNVEGIKGAERVGPTQA